jgi:dephospho-CoA kinase
MLKVGLTGGIACGKSTVLALFERLGAHTLRADEVAHQLMLPGSEVYERIVAAFGRAILAADGAIARPRLAAAAFPARIAELNAIVHPAVHRWEEDWMSGIGRQEPNAVAICEAALLIESGGRHRFDRLVVVTCSMEQKIARFAQRTGVSDEAARAEVERRMAAQLSEEEKARLAEYVIPNSGSLDELAARVQAVWAELTKLAQE